MPAPPGATFSSPGFILENGFGQDQLDFSSNLIIHCLDVEALRQWECGRFFLVLSGGGRYLEISQNYMATLVNNAVFPDGNTANEVQFLSFGHNFQGGGPTLATEGRFQVGNSGLSLFAHARGSLLVGTTHQSLILTQTVNDPSGEAGGDLSAMASADNRKDHVLPVAEVELGLEYALRLRRINPYFRATVVDQTYFNAGNASGQDGSLSLFGAQFSLGLNY